MYTYKLTKIKFNNDEEIQLGNLTVIIGPNNVGKSQILKDIVQRTTKQQPLPCVVVKDVEWIPPQSLEELCEAYSLECYQDTNNNWIFRTLEPELFQERQVNASFWDNLEHISGYLNNKSNFAENFGFALLAFITTEYRLQLVKESPSADHERQEINLLQTLYNAGSSLESEIQNLIKEAFGKEIKLDFTVPQRLRLRVGDDFSSIPSDPRDAKQPMQQFEKLDNQGDGIRSFVGIAIALLATKRTVFLIDEPEAFLHPPQASRIGRFIAEQASNKRQIVITTHSVDVLRGILNHTNDVKVIRVDRKHQINHFNIPDPSILKRLVNDPLLSSARVLDGLFYSGVVVVEADSDGRFYHIASDKRRNDIDLHFVNADNKQTVPRISTLYQDMGVRRVGILDFVVLYDSTEFKKQLVALDLEKETITSLLGIREKIAAVAKELPLDERLKFTKVKITELLESLQTLESKTFSSEYEEKSEKENLLREIERGAKEIADSNKKWKIFKQKGREALPTELQSEFDVLWGVCSQKGLFINPCGELESMLPSIPYTSNKRGWITDALTLLPSLKVDDNKYLGDLSKRFKSTL